MNLVLVAYVTFYLVTVCAGQSNFGGLKPSSRSIQGYGDLNRYGKYESKGYATQRYMESNSMQITECRRVLSDRGAMEYIVRDIDIGQEADEDTG